jgi:CHAT domain-containing protein/Tfp pilus assembly protein PilF
MGTTRWLGVVLLAACAVSRTQGQEIPKATLEGQKAVNELARACVADGGLKVTGQGPGESWQIDPARLRTTVAARRNKLTPALRDALVAGFATAGPDMQPVFLGLLEAVAQESKDERALGFAAFFTGWRRQQEHQLPGAVEAYRHAVKHFAAAPEPSWQATSLNNMGLALRDQGEYGRALGYYQQALDMTRHLYPESQYPQGHPHLATSLTNVGSVLHAQGEYGRALGYYQQALDMRRKLYPESKYPQGHPDLAGSLNRLGDVLDSQGEYGRALGYLQQALDMRRKLYPEGKYPQGHPDLAQSLNNLGAVLRAQGEYGRALGYYQQALQALRLTRDPVPLDRGTQAAPLLQPLPLTVDITVSRAWTLQAALPARPSVDQLRACEQAYALATAVQERIRTEVLQHEQSKLQLGEKADLIVPLRVALCGYLFKLEGKVDDLRTAFATVEQGRARVFLESLGQANASRLAGLPPVLRQEEERLSRRLRVLDAGIRSAQSRPGDEAAAQARKLWHERQDAEEELRRFEQKLARTHPQYAGLRYPKPCTVEQARACLDPGEVALLFSVCKNQSYAVVVHARPDPNDRAEGLAVVRLPGRQVLREKVEAITQREKLEEPEGIRALGAELYGLLLGPLEQHIAGKNLVIVPDGPLDFLPFELLVEGAGADIEGHYLIEGHRIRYAPSLTALHLIRLWEQGRKAQPDRPLFALGDPVFDSKDDRLHQQKVIVAQATQQERGELLLRAGMAGRLLFQRLLATGPEVRGIADLLHAQPGAVLTGTQASEAAVKQASGEGRLARCRYVHFATHGILGLDRGQPPALVLSQVGTTGQEDEYGRDDGFLTLPEVSALKLNADLVVLSACRTGEGRMHNGEGVSGLARVFLYAGSRGVVCSLWSVEDQATSELMQGMYRRLQKGESTPDALRQAKLDLIKDERPPFLWAPFIHLGR